MDEVARLQEHLLLIRRCVGWTAKEFGEKIGVTRQTINNLEANGRRKNAYILTKTQYLAIRYVLNEEILSSPDDTEMLVRILDIFVDRPELYTKEQREQCLVKANLMAPAILAGTSSRKTVSKEWIGAIGVAATIAAIPLSFISLPAGAVLNVIAQQVIKEIGKSGTDGAENVKEN